MKDGITAGDANRSSLDGVERGRRPLEADAVLGGDLGQDEALTPAPTSYQAQLHDPLKGYRLRMCHMHNVSHLITPGKS